MKRTIAFIVSILCAFSLFAQTNPTTSPDSKMVAYTDGNNNLLVSRGDKIIPVTCDGTEVILNGYASWIYYEEIFGRPSKYKAFWWSPDSKKIAFYRFDNTSVPVFPIFVSDSTPQGKLLQTRYPCAGQNNPSVKIGIYDIQSATTTWADLEDDPQVYYGTPFWSDDSKALFVQRIPRVQNQLDLFRIDASTGEKKQVYHEDCATWTDWMDEMLFSPEGFYLAREFEGDWAQIYFLSYDGKTFRRLTSGPNYHIHLLKLDQKTGTVFYTANRDSDVRAQLFCVNRQGKIKALTPLEYSARNIEISSDFKSFKAELSNFSTPTLYVSAKVSSAPSFKVDSSIAPAGFDISKVAHKELIYITIEGMKVPAAIIYPKDFDPSVKYPVVMEIYGGPANAYVTDLWKTLDEQKQWFWENGYISIVADSRVSGHNGRKGVDLSFKDFVTVPVYDFVKWAEYLESLPYVGAIGVEGFSFGGTNTATLVIKHPEHFCCGIAGGGVYDWMLYDSHYTERYMLPPYLNEDGYKRACVLEFADLYDPSKSRLKINHGTGDDNVHFLNSLMLIDKLQQSVKSFDLMIYPNGKHGYRGAQLRHFHASDREFWEQNLKSKIKQ